MSAFEGRWRWSHWSPKKEQCTHKKATTRVLMLGYAILLLATCGWHVATGHIDHDWGAALPPVAALILLAAIVLEWHIHALHQRLSEAVGRIATLQRENEARQLSHAKRFRARKIEQTGQFASGIAHDFNNVFELILGCTSQRDRFLALNNRAAQDAKVARLLEEIEAAAMSGARMTQRLLAFSRIELSKPQQFDVALAIVELSPLLRHLLAGGQDLHLALGKGTFHVRFDRSEFDLMLLAIASNARDAMPHGGCFRVEIVREDGHVRISLSDTGHGMTMDVQERVFQPFFSTKAPHGGSGLSLAAIRAQIVESDGDIWVESEREAGSTFHVRLPAAEACDPAITDVIAPT